MEKSEKTVGGKGTSTRLNTVSGALKGTFQMSQIRQRELEREIKEDKDGLAEVDNELYKLNKRRAHLEQRIKEGAAWMENYEQNIAPLEGQYDKMFAGIGEIYSRAKEGHAKGLELLKAEFDYHPAYKRHSDKFGAVPFHPDESAEAGAEPWSSTQLRQHFRASPFPFVAPTAAPVLMRSDGDPRTIPSVP
eukprot:CAMPEP_0177607868 /NCGR_PEP_ID=MMETSP0419_2-20121207/18155_1 /TAXON_ID=582737 /ORGANISM="Tetraselmis sp., Strain GSL018" /LENGTH=190 /DNA_ID=CAMNT_0019102495 /DNA_START=13 /DNA_END=582 /DNA_ORIENTATION=-